MQDEPLLSGELRARADLTLAAVLRALLVVLPLMAAANFAVSGFSPVTWVLLLSLPYIASLYFLQRRGRFTACVHAVVFGLIVVSITVAALSGSVRSVGTIGIVVAITMGGVFLGHRTLMLAVGLGSLGIAGLILAENAGWLRVPDYSVAAAHWVMYSVIFAAVALVLSYVRSLLVDLVVRLADELEQRTLAEAAGRASEARFRQVFDLSPVGMTVTRVSDGRYLEANRADQHNLGYTREELLGRTTLEMGAWSSQDDRQRFLEVLRTHGSVEGYETRMRHRSGEIVECRVWARFAEIGGEQCVLGSTINVTDQLRAERALQHDLRESERRYRSLFQAATDCILVISPQGTILDINQYGCRSLGYTREELVEGSFARILEETKLARLLPRAPRVKTERRSVRAEQDMRAKDGSLRTMEFTAGPLPDGNILVVARDVTERRRQERLLQNIARGVSPETGDEFFRSLVQALSAELPADMVFIAEVLPAGDRVRTMVCWSDGVQAENFEYPLQGSPCVQAIDKRGTVIYPDGVAAQFPEDRGLERLGMSGYVGTSLFDASGTAIGVLVALTREPIARNEFFVSIIEIFAARAAAEIERSRAESKLRELNSVLEQRVRDRTAELETANRDLESFSYSVSHDLRAPLRAINGFSKMLREKEAHGLGERGRALLQRVEDGARRAAGLIDALLEFSRLGRNPVTKIRVSMSALVAEVLREFAAQPETQRAEVQLRALPDSYGDPILLKQVWQNLIGNALKYSRTRERPVVEIGCDAEGYFVRDNGVGFDMEYAPKLFGMFERLHSPAEFEGTGIGLATAQRIVQRHGGVIRAEGETGRGATFRFRLAEGR